MEWTKIEEGGGVPDDYKTAYLLLRDSRVVLGWCERDAGGWYCDASAGSGEEVADDEVIAWMPVPVPEAPAELVDTLQLNWVADNNARVHKEDSVWQVSVNTASGSFYVLAQAKTLREALAIAMQGG